MRIAQCVAWILMVISGGMVCSAGPSIRDDGAIVIESKPIFPVGFYHVSWVRERMGKAQRADMAMVQHAGFTLFAGTVDMRADSVKLIDQAESTGVWLIPEVNFKAMPKVISKLNQRKGVLAWIVGDDVNEKESAQIITERCKLVKKLAPQHLTYVSAYNSGEKWLGKPGVETWLKAGVDIIGMQSYPIPWDRQHGRFGGFDFAPGPHAKSNYRARVFYGMRRTVLKARQFENRAVLANLQAFKWNRKGKQWRYPTPGELRNMTYQALVAGVNGILYYTFYDETSYLPDQPELWKSAIDLGKQIKQLEPILISGKRHEMTDKQDPGRTLFFCIWQHKDELLVIAVNTSEAAGPAEVNIQLPVAMTEAKDFFAPSRKTGLSVNGKTLKVKIGHEGVLVLRVSR